MVVGINRQRSFQFLVVKEKVLFLERSIDLKRYILSRRSFMRI